MKVTIVFFVFFFFGGCSDDADHCTKLVSVLKSGMTFRKLEMSREGGEKMQHQHY